VVSPFNYEVMKQVQIKLESQSFQPAQYLPVMIFYLYWSKIKFFTNFEFFRNVKSPKYLQQCITINTYIDRKGQPGKVK
jgi:hypothetical protein